MPDCHTSPTGIGDEPVPVKFSFFTITLNYSQLTSNTRNYALFKCAPLVSIRRHSKCAARTLILISRAILAVFAVSHKPWVLVRRGVTAIRRSFANWGWRRFLISGSFPLLKKWRPLFEFAVDFYSIRTLDTACWPRQPGRCTQTVQRHTD